MGIFIGIDLGATSTRAGLINESGKILRKISIPTPHTDVISVLIALIRKLIPEDDLAGSEGIGISAAGPVDVKKGVLINPPNLPFRDVLLTGPLSEEFDVPVRLANDCHAGIIGEAYFGDARRLENAAYITLSTGIGGGIIADGRLVLGRGGNAAEIGHFFVDTTYGMICGCGYPGHWEGYASGRFLPSFFTRWCAYHNKRIRGEIPLTAEKIFGAARGGNPIVLEFLETLGEINGRGMSDVIVAYDPEWIILDGSVVLNNAPYVIPPMEKHIDHFLPVPTIRLSTLKGDAPLLGASVIARSYETAIGSPKRAT